MKQNNSSKMTLSQFKAQQGRTQTDLKSISGGIMGACHCVKKTYENTVYSCEGTVVDKQVYITCD